MWKNQDTLWKTVYFIFVHIWTYGYLISILTILSDSSNMKVHASTIRKIWHMFNFHGRFAWKKCLLSKKNMKARLKFARENADRDQDLWNNVLWTDEYNTELIRHQNRGHLWCKPSIAFQEKNLMPTVKHEVEVSWFGDALLQQDPTSSPS